MKHFLGPLPYLFVGAFFLTILFFGVSRTVPCPSLKHKPYTYKTHVRVVAGFYKGATGYIVEPSELYSSSLCGNKPSFKVEIDRYTEINIDQADLEPITK